MLTTFPVGEAGDAADLLHDERVPVLPTESNVDARDVNCGRVLNDAAVAVLRAGELGCAVPSANTMRKPFG